MWYHNTLHVTKLQVCNQTSHRVRSMCQCEFQAQFGASKLRHLQEACKLHFLNLGRPRGGLGSCGGPLVFQPSMSSRHLEELQYCGISISDVFSQSLGSHLRFIHMEIKWMWETLECPWPEVLEVLSPCCGSEGTEVTRCCPMGFVSNSWMWGSCHLLAASSWSLGTCPF